MLRLIEQFRLPESFVKISAGCDSSQAEGFFRFGRDAICYGRCSEIATSPSIHRNLPDAASSLHRNGMELRLPFDPDQVIDNMMLERYPKGFSSLDLNGRVRSLYYRLRPALPVAFRKHLQRYYLSGWDKITYPQWPVDCTVEITMDRLLALLMQAQGLDSIPFIWFWPSGHPSCAIVTHDVETQAGRDFCPTLMDLNDSVGIKSSFQIIPQSRYPVPEEFLADIRARGFEINVHDLDHDGNLFRTEQSFRARVSAVNDYGRRFGAQGFRAGVMYRNQEWYRYLEFQYDMSVPNVAHLEPQRGGCCTVRPYFVGNILELPLTTTQDYALLHLLCEHSMDLWLQQIETIRKHNGLISVLVHPDYVLKKREQDLYLELLHHLDSLRSSKDLWIATPNEVNVWWRTRNKLSLERDGQGWRIVGPGSERATLAYAHLDGDSVRYSITSSNSEVAGAATR